jgi:outer membrane protein TolC
VSGNGHKAWARVLLALTLAPAPALLHAQLTLATAVDLAQRNSMAVKLAQADVQRAQAALAQTKDAFIPTVDVGSGLPALPAVGFTGGVPSILNGNVQTMIFSLPQFQYIKAARAAVAASLLNLKSAREQVALDASTAYIELDTVNQELDAARQQESFADRLMAIEQERTEAGVDALSDLLQARLTAAQLKLACLHLETRAATLAKQLSTLTGMPAGSIALEHSSIPEIPAVKADVEERIPLAVQSAQMLALSKEKTAKGNRMSELYPQMSFNAQYSRSTGILNDFAKYYATKYLPTNNFISGFDIQFPLFDWSRRDQGRQSSAEALRARAEAEQAQQQNDIQIAQLTGNLRELDALAEVASLKQQIADEQLKSVLAQLELGNGASSGPAAQPQLSPKAEQLARIDERQKFEDSLDAALELAKARLNLLRALGHMEDWLAELRAK